MCDNCYDGVEYGKSLFCTDFISNMVENEDFNINAKISNKDSRTFLHMACATGDLKSVQYLIKNGADITAKDNDGYTPIFHCLEAPYEKGMKVVRWLCYQIKGIQHQKTKEGYLFCAGWHIHVNENNLHHLVNKLENETYEKINYKPRK